MKRDVKGKIERRIEETRKREKRLKQLMEELTKKRGCCISKAEALDRSMLRTRLERGSGPVVRHKRAGSTERLVFVTDIVIVHCGFKPLTPNDLYISRTTPLTSIRCILYIYSTNVGTEYFKHALYSPFFLSKMQFVS